MDSNKQIKLGVFMSYLSIGINILVGLLFTPWMISSIGREEYGLFTLANSVIMFFMFDFGLSSAITRFLSKYLAEGRKDKVNNCLGLVYKLYMSADIIFVLALSSFYFFIPNVYKELTPDEIEKFKVIYAIAGIYSVLSFPFIPANGVLTAHERFAQIKICDVIHKLVLVVVMTGCLAFGGGLYSLVLVNALSGGITIVMKMWCISHYTDCKINFSYFERREFRGILSFAGWTMLVALSQRLVTTIAPSILGVYAGSASIAILGIAMAIEGYTYTFSNAIAGMFLPKVSRVVSSNNGDVLPLMTKVGRFQIIIVGIITLAAICLGKDFIYLWVGDGFDDSYYCAVLMVLPTFFFAPEEIAVQTVLARNKVKKQAIILIICSVLNIVLASILSKYFGSIGMAASICIVYLIRGIWQNISLYYKDLSIDLVKFLNDSFLSMSPALIATLVVGLLMNYILTEHQFRSFLLKSFILFFVYSITMLMRMNKFEKNTLLGPVKKIITKTISK